MNIKDVPEILQNTDEMTIEKYTELNDAGYEINEVVDKDIFFLRVYSPLVWFKKIKVYFWELGYRWTFVFVNEEEKTAYMVERKDIKKWLTISQPVYEPNTFVMSEKQRKKYLSLQNEKNIDVTKATVSTVAITGTTFHFTIYGRPASKKNSKRIIRLGNGRHIPVSSKQYEVFKTSALSQLPEIETITKKVRIDYVFYLKGKLRQDVDNAINSINDVLQEAKIISDDNNIVKGSFEKIQGNKDWSTVITITPLE